MTAMFKSLLIVLVCLSVCHCDKKRNQSGTSSKEQTSGPRDGGGGDIELTSQDEIQRIIEELRWKVVPQVFYRMKMAILDGKKVELDDWLDDLGIYPKAGQDVEMVTHTVRKILESFDKGANGKPPLLELIENLFFNYQSKPCLDKANEPKDAVASGNEICFSLDRLSKKLSAPEAPFQLTAHIFHELSHLYGFENEEDALEFGNFILSEKQFKNNKTFLIESYKFIGHDLWPGSIERRIRKLVAAYSATPKNYSVSCQSVAQISDILEMYRPPIWLAPAHKSHIINFFKITKSLESENYDVCRPLTAEDENSNKKTIEKLTAEWDQFQDSYNLYIKNHELFTSQIKSNQPIRRPSVQTLLEKIRWRTANFILARITFIREDFAIRSGARSSGAMIDGPRKINFTEMLKEPIFRLMPISAQIHQRNIPDAVSKAFKVFYDKDSQKDVKKDLPTFHLKFSIADCSNTLSSKDFCFDIATLEQQASNQNLEVFLTGEFFYTLAKKYGLSETDAKEFRQFITSSEKFEKNKDFLVEAKSIDHSKIFPANLATKIGQLSNEFNANDCESYSEIISSLESYDPPIFLSLQQIADLFEMNKMAHELKSKNCSQNAIPDREMYRYDMKDFKYLSKKVHFSLKYFIGIGHL